MLAKKFIIQHGLLIMGEVQHHYELAQNDEGVVGGGRYHLHSKDGDGVFIFYGTSDKYGKVSSEQFYLVLSKSLLPDNYKNAEFFFSAKEWFTDALREYLSFKKSQHDNKS